MTIVFDKDFSEFEFGDEQEIVSQHDFEAWCCAFSEDGQSKSQIRTEYIESAKCTSLIFIQHSSPEATTQN